MTGEPEWGDQDTAKPVRLSCATRPINARPEHGAAEKDFLLPEECGGHAVGGKAGGLLTLGRAGLVVPPWCVIPAERVAGRVWERAEALGGLADFVGSWGGGHFSGIAVRSSAIGEDGVESSYAGVFESEIIWDVAELAGALSRVAASAGNARAYAGHAGYAPPMAIIVQAAVAAEIAGVCFSAQPSAARYDAAYLEAVNGMGARLVDGSAAPSKVLFGRDNAGVIDFAVGEDGPQEVTEDFLNLMRRGLKALEEALDSAVDIEWAVAGGKLYFLQVRRVTALALDISLRPRECVTSYFFDQRFSEPISPFTRSTLLKLICDVAIGDALRLRGSARVCQPVYYGGQAYVPHRVWREMLRGAPGWWLSDDLRQLFPKTCFCRNRRDAIVAPVSYARAALAAVWKHWGEVFGNLREWDLFAQGLVDRLEEISMESLPRSREDWVGVWSKYDSSSEEFLRLHRWSILWADYLFRAFRLTVSVLPEKKRRGLERRLRGDLHLKTAEANAALFRYVAGEMEKAEFLREYGHRSASLDYAAPTWGELVAVGKLDTRGEAQKPVDSKAETQVPLGLRSLWGVLCRFLELREEQRFAWEKILARQRAMVLAGAKELVARGTLGRVEDVWYLSRDELMGAMYGGVGVDGGEVKARRHRSRIDRLIRKPMFVGPEVAEVVAGSGQVLTGLGGSAGVAEGRAVHRGGPGALPEMTEPIVLVLRSLDPAWTPMLSGVAGLVIERGGLLSHAAVIAREYGIPLVIGVEDGFERVPRGAWVRVDGDRGVVEVVESRGDEGADKSG